MVSEKDFQAGSCTYGLYSSCKAHGFSWVPSFDLETAVKRKIADTFLIYFDHMLKGQVTCASVLKLN